MMDRHASRAPPITTETLRTGAEAPRVRVANARAGATPKDADTKVRDSLPAFVDQDFLAGIAISEVSQRPKIQKTAIAPIFKRCNFIFAFCMKA
jgi:hypothetical protein